MVLYKETKPNTNNLHIVIRFKVFLSYTLNFQTVGSLTGTTTPSQSGSRDNGNGVTQYALNFQNFLWEVGVGFTPLQSVYSKYCLHGR